MPTSRRSESLLTIGSGGVSWGLGDLRHVLVVERVEIGGTVGLRLQHTATGCEQPRPTVGLAKLGKPARRKGKGVRPPLSSLSCA